MLSNTSKYAIRAVIYLAVNASENKRIGIKKIAEGLGIPSPFLGKILQVLVRRRFISSTKGPHGGFGLGKDPNSISLYDIITEMDGDDLFNSCLLGAGRCDDKNSLTGYCAIHGEFEEARKTLVEIYKGKTVGDLAQKASDKNGTIIL